jgi:hypothetical protein
MIVLVENGAMIASSVGGRITRPQMIDLATFDNSERARNIVDFLTYPEWEVGTLDKGDKFHPIFKRGGE